MDVDAESTRASDAQLPMPLKLQPRKSRRGCRRCWSYGCSAADATEAIEATNPADADVDAEGTKLRMLSTDAAKAIGPADTVDVQNTEPTEAMGLRM